MFNTRHTLSALTLTLTMTTAANVVVAQNVTMELAPARATGVQNTDWITGPGPNDITLFGGGQAVEVQLFLAGWAPGQMTTYQAAIGCSTYAPGPNGALEPIATLCDTVPPGAPCQEVDTGHETYVFAGSTVIPVCDINTLCDDGSPGRIRCGSTLLFGSRTDDGAAHYGATFAVNVPSTARGTFVVSLDPHPDRTFVTMVDTTSPAPDTFVPTQIIVGCANDAECDDGDGCTLDTCSRTTAQCENTIQAPDLLGDFDHDGSIDLTDAAELPGCLTGVGPTDIPQCCRVFDMDLDRDVDLEDIGRLQAAFTGTP